MRVAMHHGLAGLKEHDWRALVPPDFPFFDWEFLSALQTSESIGRASGWQPCYLVAEDRGQALGALCAYSKSNSYGEYIFDWDWARAYHQHGLAYYPKLVAAVPFTPATGPKLLVRPDADAERVATALADAFIAIGDEQGASSWHALFLPPRDLETFAERGFSERHSLQFHWQNRGYGTFGDYLAAMEGKRRRQVQRERRQLADEGLAIARLTGDDLRDEHAATMYQFYLSTIDKKEAQPYLTEAFFHEIFQTMRDRILVVLACNETGMAVAGSLNFYKGQTLFGRYWGTLEERRNLHFELCYYQPIEFAIERRLALFEAGAQGEHKLARGFLPVVTKSAHRIRHPEFRRAIDQYLAQEREGIAAAVAEYGAHDPYR